MVHVEGFAWYVFMFLLYGWITIPIGLVSTYVACTSKNWIIKIICVLMASVCLFPVIFFALATMEIVSF